MDDSASDFDSFFTTATAISKADAQAVRTLGYYDRDCTWIAEQSLATPEAFPGIVAFVLLTIQQPFSQMADAMPDVAQHGTQSRYMWGFKPDGFRYARKNARELWQASRDFADGRKSLDDLILDYLAIPGLGIVKASFLAQLTVGEGACLDTHNLRSLGLALDAFKTPKTLTIATVRKRIATYNATWRRAGTSAYWWDSWCDGVGNRTHNARGAKVNGSFNGGGAEVSALHRLAITAGVR